MRQSPYQYHQEKTVVLANFQPTFEKNHKANTETLSLATMFVAKVSSSNPKIYVILHIDDKVGQEAFRRLRQPAYHVNGEYEEVLEEVFDEIVNEDVDNLVIIGDEPKSKLLCSAVKQKKGSVTIWSVDKTPPALMAAEFTNRQLSELPLAGAGGASQTVSVWIDLENVLFPLKKLGVQVSAKELVEVIRKISEDLGNLVSITAYADFKILARDFGPDFQYDLEELGVKTRFQINHRGKNSADIALASDMQTSLELDPAIQAVLIVSGDRDLNPAIDAARQRGKKVVVSALEQSLSEQLRRNADEVRLLDDYFRTPGRSRSNAIPDHPLMGRLLQMAARMQANRWQWVYTNRLSDILTSDEIALLLNEGLLQLGRPGSSHSVAFNPENNLARQIELASSWIPTRIDYLIRKKQMPWVDTNFIARGLQMDPKCQQLGLGQSWATAAAWLDATATAGLIVKQTMPHPDNKEKIIDTWWPLNHVSEESKVEPAQPEEAAPTTEPEVQKQAAQPDPDKNKDEKFAQARLNKNYGWKVAQSQAF